MIRRFTLVAMLLALAIVPAASAQQRGRGGFGGFGGAQASSAALLRIPEVRQELKLTDDQQKQVEEALGSRRGGQGFNREDFQNLSQEERQKRFAELREQAEKASKETDEKIAKILDESQQKRLGELRLQREGINALRRKEVAEKLGLSDEQQQKIRKIQEESRPELGNFRNLSDDERREAFTKMREQREKADKDTLAVLTDEQQSKWNEMKGKEFDFPQRRGGRRPNN
jgi:hypothetical protein